MILWRMGRFSQLEKAKRSNKAKKPNTKSCQKRYHKEYLLLILKEEVKSIQSIIKFDSFFSIYLIDMLILFMTSNIKPFLRKNKTMNMFFFRKPFDKITRIIYSSS